MHRTVESRRTVTTVTTVGTSPYVIGVSDGETQAVVPYPPTAAGADHKGAMRHALAVADDLGYGTEAHFTVMELVRADDKCGGHYEQVAHLTHGQAIDVVAGTLDPTAMDAPNGPCVEKTAGECPVPGCQPSAGEPARCECRDQQCPGPVTFEFRPAGHTLLEDLYGRVG